MARIDIKDLGVGIGAGLVSALLFAVLLKATILAIVLYLLAPLPILIVGLGWSHRAALVAVAAGALALALVVAPFLGIGFAVYLALPAWWLAYLTMLGRPDGQGGLEWYPTGRLLAWIAGTAALAFVAIAVIAAPNYATFHGQLAGMARKIVQVQTGPARAPASRPGTSGANDPAPPADAAPAPAEIQNDVAEALATVAPALAAQGLAILLAFYLWAAGRIVQISGRLTRPWPDIPATAMPRGALGVLAAAAALALAPGYVGVLGVALTGALTAAFALQGLAAFHDRSRGRPGRGALLIGLYVVLLLTQGIALIALTVFGIADTALDRRRPREATVER